MGSRLALRVRSGVLSAAARPPAARAANLDLALRLQFVGPFDDDLIAFVDAAGEHRSRPFTHGHLHRPHVDALVLLDYVDVRSLRAVLDGRCRYGDGVLPYVDLQARIDELVRKESAIAVVED